MMDDRLRSRENDLLEVGKCFNVSRNLASRPFSGDGNDIHMISYSALKIHHKPEWPLLDFNCKDINMREANGSPTRFKVKEDDVDSSGTCFTSEIVSPKRILCYQSYEEISVFEVVPKRFTQ
ncbi:hypothetical protein TNCV_3297251 [Trichonephila clavipes]|uniref:Uncharacterized protein n=1 Tax=Trichonephila clavipes TaxID=2585209 RepID=A0A8X6T1F2_TRICX|nr:hypothetical protein TNCV_3297251 [Trichonephila clavipes]